MIMLENKYKKWYFSLMEKAKIRTEIPQEIEKHHILPKSLGGLNIKENIVRLTIREHLLAHRLLPHFLTGLEKAKMYHAYHRMVNGRQGKYVKMSLSTILEAKKNYSEARKVMRMGTKHSEETKRKISESNKGKIISQEARQKISKSNTGKLVGKKKPDGFGEKISKTLTGKKKTKEHIEKINKNPEKIKKTALKHRGMKRSPEAKEKMRQAALLRIQRNGGPWNKGKKLTDGKFLPQMGLKLSEESPKHIIEQQ